MKALFLGLLLLSAAPPFRQMARACEGPFFEYGSKAQGKTFASLATYNFIRDTPNWTPGDPLPIKEEDIIKAARAEVARHVANPDHWFYSAYDIIRFREFLTVGFSFPRIPNHRGGRPWSQISVFARKNPRSGKR